MALLGLKDAANIHLYSNTTTKPVLYADYMTTTDINFTQESDYALIKGVKTIRWDKSREGQLTTSMQVFELKWLSLLFGTEFASSSVPIAKREKLLVSSQTCTLSATPKAGSLIIYILDADGHTHGVEQVAGVPSTTENKYSLATATLTFNSTTFPDNTVYVSCYYLVDSTVSNFTIDTTTYPSGYKMYMDTALRNTSQVDEMTQIVLYNVKPQSNMKLTMSADGVATIETTWDIMGDANGDMMTLSKIA